MEKLCLLSLGFKAAALTKSYQFHDKVVMITGSSQGIGKATALEFLRSGAQVVINGRNPEKLNQTKEEFESMGFKPMAFAGDLADHSACQQLISKTIEQFGRIDILVNNAGGGFRGRMDETTPNAFSKVIDSNLMSSVYTTLAALEEIKKTRGSIVFISSLSGIHGMPKNGPYCVAKMGLTAFVQTLKIELSGSGVHIGIIMVGWTDYDENKKVVNADGSLVPITRKHLQTREDVAIIILRMIRTRKHRAILTFPGKMLFFLDKFFPALLELILKNSEKKGKYNK